MATIYGILKVKDNGQTTEFEAWDGEPFSADGYRSARVLVALSGMGSDGEAGYISPSVAVTDSDEEGGTYAANTSLDHTGSAEDAAEMVLDIPVEIDATTPWLDIAVTDDGATVEAVTVVLHDNRKTYVLTEAAHFSVPGLPTSYLPAGSEITVDGDDQGPASAAVINSIAKAPVTKIKG